MLLANSLRCQGISCCYTIDKNKLSRVIARPPPSPATKNGSKKTFPPSNTGMQSGSSFKQLKMKSPSVDDSSKDIRLVNQRGSSEQTSRLFDDTVMGPCSRCTSKSGQKFDKTIGDTISCSANHRETEMKNAVDSESLYEWIDFSLFRGEKKTF